MIDLAKAMLLLEFGSVPFCLPENPENGFCKTKKVEAVCNKCSCSSSS